MSATTAAWRRPLPWPLSNAHWSLPALIVAAWCLLLFGATCDTPRPTALASALLATTVSIATWASHLRAQASVGWRKLSAIVGGAAYDLILLLVALIVCAIPLAALTATQDCMTPRLRTTELLLAASPARTTIEARASATRTLHGAGVGVGVDKTRNIGASLVTDDGVIIVDGADPPAVVMFQPTLAGDHVTWTCKGFPASLMPATCR